MKHNKNSFTKEVLIEKTIRPMVNRYTRAGYCGKTIICPHCDYERIVYHFTWCALMCPGCRSEVQKNEFFLKQ